MSFLNDKFAMTNTISNLYKLYANAEYFYFCVEMIFYTLLLHKTKIFLINFIVFREAAYTSTRRIKLLFIIKYDTPGMVRVAVII